MKLGYQVILEMCDKEASIYWLHISLCDRRMGTTKITRRAGWKL